MSYAVKEMFLTLQGEGQQSGRRAVFCRMSGCNLWTGREADRHKAICDFCDTDFVGTDGANGGRYDAAALAAKAAKLWGTADKTARYIVITGGEPMLQVDDALIDALHREGFVIAMESNGTIAANPAIDWICISPKSGSEVVQRQGQELKLVWPQTGIDPKDMEDWDFAHFLIQPMDMGEAKANRQSREAAVRFVMDNPKWRLTLQDHKTLGLP